MGEVSAEQKKQAAIEYVKTNAYPDSNEVEVMGMVKKPEGTVVGVRAQKYSLLGKQNTYALITVNDEGTAILANKCSKDDVEKKLGQEENEEMPGFGEIIKNDVEYIREIYDIIFRNTK